ncbi:MAG: RIP metalloprotease RseP [Muribaculaceae bacterium]|nr:RIP metalloprotease RseP [Muribaculaceae bacterium]
MDSAFWIKALQLIAGLGLLVFLHELGHYFFARLFGIKVEKFYLFFNPYFSIFKWKPGKGVKFFSSKDFEAEPTPADHKPTWRDTTYGIGWVPLGGYCAIAGMIDETQSAKDLAAEPQSWEFRTKPAWQRLLVMLGGVLFNFLTAIIIYAGIVYTYGEQIVPFDKAYEGMDYPAAALAVGFQNGDIPLAADGEPLSASDDNYRLKMIEAKEVTVLRNHADTVKIAIPEKFIFALEKDTTGVAFCSYRMPVVVAALAPKEPAELAGIQKGDRIISVDSVKTTAYTEFTAELKKNAGKEVAIGLLRGNDTISVNLAPTEHGKIGIQLAPITDVYEVETIEYSLWRSIPKGWDLGVTTLTNYVSQFKYVFTSEGAQSLGGFGTIGSIFPDQWQWLAFWNIVAFLSVILAFMNIIPIPGLDGGHVLFLLWEIVTRRKPSDKFLQYAETAGIIFIIALLLYANGNDIYRFFIK